LDGNGNPIVGEIDRYGQSSGNRDGVGSLGTTERNGDNLVSQTKSPTGGNIEYTYDERGNVIATTEQIRQPGLQTNLWHPETPVTFNGQSSLAIAV
jgi:YD repeat-containing protein